MAPDPGLLPVLARLLEYPDPGYLQSLDRCRGEAGPGDPESTARLRSFATALEGQSVQALQELFTRTFDFDPKCTLDVGWHLYGENYERGDFLARMRDELRRHGIDEDHELPDYLPHLLDLLARAAPDLSAEVAGRFVVPAVEKMLAGLVGQDNPFEHVLTVVHGAASALTGATIGGSQRA